MLVDDPGDAERHQSYLFTSRAEFRLQLRGRQRRHAADPARCNLGLVETTPAGPRLPQTRSVAAETELPQSHLGEPPQPACHGESELGCLTKTIEHEHRLFGCCGASVWAMDLMSHAQRAQHASPLVSRETLGDLVDSVVEQVEITASMPRLHRSTKAEVARACKPETAPTWTTYCRSPPCRSPGQAKTGKHRPETLGQAARISGITPIHLPADDPPEERWLQKASRPCPSRWPTPR